VAGSIAGSVLALLYLVGSWMVGGGGGAAGEGVSSGMYTAAGASQPLGGGGEGCW
jgi:hypothetical protein